MRQTPLAGGSSKSTRMTSICPQVKSQKESMKPSGFNCINLPYQYNCNFCCYEKFSILLRNLDSSGKVEELTKEKEDLKEKLTSQLEKEGTVRYVIRGRQLNFSLYGPN